MNTIVYSGGFWSTNIGNAFFNKGIMYALEKARPNDRVVFTGDPPGWFWPSAREQDDSLVLIDDLDCDYIAISGPLLNENFGRVWGKSLSRLRQRGTKVLLISAGCMEYTDEEYEAVAPVLEDIEPHLLVTRDAEAYRRYRGFAQHSHNGICFAFFCSDYTDLEVGLDSNYLAVTFDKGHDYDVLTKFETEIRHLLNTDSWPETTRATLSDLKRSRAASQIRTFDDHRVVRPYHVANPATLPELKSLFLGYRPFDKPNTYIADIPEGYLLLYRTAPLTIAERVHACVPALAFGNYAWMVSDTKRAHLFDRVGAGDVRNKPLRLGAGQLKEEKQAMLDILSTVL